MTSQPCLCFLAIFTFIEVLYEALPDLLVAVLGVSIPLICSSMTFFFNHIISWCASDHIVVKTCSVCCIASVPHPSLYDNNE
jgi:hypothetical protein